MVRCEFRYNFIQETPGLIMSNDEITIRIDDLRGPEIAALLEAHLDHMRTISPPESVHALDLDALRMPDITFWTMWYESKLVGCGALRELNKFHGEIKSMHTVNTLRGKGIGRRMLTHVIDEASQRGYDRLSLETGATDDFIAARSLYAAFGFAICPPFGHYTADPFSTCMTFEMEQRQ